MFDLFFDYDWFYVQICVGWEWGFGLVWVLLDCFGVLDWKFQIICVVGINGKGSICVMFEVGLLVVGVWVGCFISLYLYVYEECIWVGGENFDLV